MTRFAALGLIFSASLAATALSAETPASAPPEVMTQCLACHTLEPGKHSMGPSLAGIFGKKAAMQEGYYYSYALEEAGLVWDEETLDAYLANPARFVPEGNMNTPVPDAAERAAIVAYLKGL